MVYAKAQTRQNTISQANEEIVIVEDTIKIEKTQPIKASELKTTFGKNGKLKTFQVNLYNPTSALPELTIPNLIAEIRKNNIKHPKIVLAQAILETGWFKSSVCRKKHNLFGLTNPHTDFMLYAITFETSLYLSADSLKINVDLSHFL